jgi:hypothetical protein
MERIIPGVNDQEEWNEEISKMQEDIEWEPLIEFLERLKEPIEKIGDANRKAKDAIDKLRELGYEPYPKEQNAND